MTIWCFAGLWEIEHSSHHRGKGGFETRPYGIRQRRTLLFPAPPNAPRQRSRAIYFTSHLCVFLYHDSYCGYGIEGE